MERLKRFNDLLFLRSAVKWIKLGGHPIWFKLGIRQFHLKLFGLLRQIAYVSISLTREVTA